MKISEAILKGCEMVPEQTFGRSFLRAFEGGGFQAACAYGAALVGYHGVCVQWPESPPEWKIVLSRMCSEFGLDAEDTDVTVDEWIATQNDMRRWSRERIAAELARVGL